jgi:hypothetical protein
MCPKTFKNKREETKKKKKIDFDELGIKEIQTNENAASTYFDTILNYRKKKRVDDIEEENKN